MDIKKAVFNKYMFIFGVIAPAPIISFFSITAYVWMLLIFSFFILIDILRTMDKNNKMILDKSYILYSISVIISCSICYIRMPREWISDVLTFAVQFCCVFVLFIYLSMKENIEIGVYFIKGVHVSALIQLFWGYIQIITNKFGIDINTLIFDNYLNMYNGTATHYSDNNVIKISGFCWNAGNYAPLMIIGYLLSNNIIIKFGFILIALISGSRTLIFGMIICLFLQVLLKKIQNGIITQKRLLFYCVIFAIICIGFLLKYNVIFYKILSILNSLNVVKNFSTEGSTNTHVMYLLNVLDVARKNDIISNMFGYGPKCSGYPFVKYYDFYSDIGKWCVECDPVNTLWNYGAIGFGTYYFWYFKNFIKCRRNIMYKVLFLTLFLMGFMYNITFNWVFLFLLIIFILNTHDVDVFEMRYTIINKV